jgi:chemotaxis protein CheZ
MPTTTEEARAMAADSTEALLRQAVRAEVAPLFDQLHRFVDRRIAELSAEVDGAVQLADMSEAKMSRQLTEIHAQIANVVAVPAAATRNSGVELEAVVQATEAAANTILEAAEAIQDFISSGIRDDAAIQGLADRVNAIFEACSFQDVTGQRIRRAIQHLQQVEEALQAMLPGGEPPARPQQVVVRNEYSTVSAPARATADLAQDDIDALLNG